VALVVLVIAAVATMGMPNDPPRILGELVAWVSIPALVAGFFARRSAKVWPMWKIITVYVVVLIVVFAATIGNLAKSPR
jgi:hypothetical protein